MLDFIRFWKFLYRLFLGGLFVTEVTVLIGGKPFVNLLVEAAVKIDVEFMKSLTSSVFLLALVVIICTLGLNILETIVIGLERLLQLLFDRSSLKRFFTGFERLGYLLLSDSSLISRYFNNSKQTVSSFLVITSYSNTDSPAEEWNLYEEHRKRIIEHIDGLTDFEVVQNIGRAHSLTQEIVRQDNLKDEIRSSWYLVIGLILLFPICSILELVAPIGSLSFLIVLITIFSTIPTFIEKRKRYIALVVHGYLSNMVIGPSATIEDRAE